MTNRIWKFPLTATDRQKIKLPVGAKVLTVQTEYHIPCMWILLDIDQEQKEERTFAIYGTGNPMPQNPGEYIATFQMNDVSLVFHVFELK